MKKKNIYILDEYVSSQKNGIGTYLRELLYCFNSLEFNVCLIVFNAETEEFKILEEKSIKKILFPVMKDHFIHLVGVIDKFLRLYIEDSSKNVFFINHTPCGDLLESLKIHFPLSKIVFTIHDFVWTMPLLGNLKEYNRILKKISVTTAGQASLYMNSIFEMYKKDKKMFECADYIICLSKDTFSVLEHIYKINKNKIFYISNGLRDIKRRQISDISQREDTKKSLHLRKEDKILLFIGRPTRQKGIFDLLAAMPIVLKCHPNVKLVIVGDGNEVSMKKIVNTISPIATSVILTGQINRITLNKWLSIADIGVISSYYEQCTYAGIEMMMFGLPIVVSDGLGLNNMFNNINAKIAKIGNRKHTKEYQHNLAKAIIELLQSSELCHKLGYEARKTYEWKYMNGIMKDKYKKLIVQIT
ncbi:glycosyl transferase [Bacteroidia bacterium]|nr:glycosyl transferase [Bacteroidia bacterium]GHV40314.1 glycosyl transferase [Bacteroidia bacterium]